MRKTWKIGESFHSDVCGPMSVESLGGARYFITFIDDASGYRYVLFARSKAQVPEKFREFAKSVETKFEHPLKVFRSDNGTEYVNEDLSQYFKKKGITVSHSAPHTSEQNGKSERANRTIVESVRTMMKARDLPTMLWAKAVNMAAYLQNRTLSRSHPEKTPYEAWHGEKPRVDHLRIFGSTAYAHIPKQFRKKFGPKSKKLIFVGYQENSSNYRLFDQTTRKVSVSRDVVFNEKDTDYDCSSGNENIEIVFPLKEAIETEDENEREEDGDT